MGHRRPQARLVVAAVDGEDASVRQLDRLRRLGEETGEAALTA
jgi:hypothetical protein